MNRRWINFCFLGHHRNPFCWRGEVLHQSAGEGSHPGGGHHDQAEHLLWTGGYQWAPHSRNIGHTQKAHPSCLCLHHHLRVPCGYLCFCASSSIRKTPATGLVPWMQYALIWTWLCKEPISKGHILGLGNGGDIGRYYQPLHHPIDVLWVLNYFIHVNCLQ